MNESVLPKRSGSRPKTTPTNPHTQLEPNPEREVVDEAYRYASGAHPSLP